MAEAKLVRKGRDVSFAGLLDQARAHLRLQEEHAARLRRAGWTEEHGADLAAALAKVEELRGDALEARGDSKAELRREKEGLARAKRFKQKLLLALGDLRAEGLVEEGAWKLINASGPLGRSTPRMVDYLMSIAGLVERYDPRLAPYFGGESASAELRASSEELEAAQAEQEVGRKGLPAKTREVYLAKAQLLALLEKLNRIARIAFAGDPSARRLFRMHLLARATKRRAARKTSAPS